MKKVSRPSDVIWFEEIPNVGKRIANDFKKLGFSSPQQLKKKNPFKLYQKLCKITGSRQDPCVLDVFMAAVYFMDGKGARPLWAFTAYRKKNFADI